MKKGGVYLMAAMAMVLTVFSFQAAAAIPPQEIAALIALYNDTSGDGWANSSGWKEPPLADDGFAMPGSECTWYGVTCDGEAIVIRISLAFNNLTGFVSFRRS